MSMLFIQKQLKGDCMTFAAEQVCFEVQPGISFIPEHLAFMKWRTYETRGGRNICIDLLKTSSVKNIIYHPTL